MPGLDILQNLVTQRDHLLFISMGEKITEGPIVIAGGDLQVGAALQIQTAQGPVVGLVFEGVFQERLRLAPALFGDQPAAVGDGHRGGVRLAHRAWVGSVFGGRLQGERHRSDLPRLL